MAAGLIIADALLSGLSSIFGESAQDKQAKAAREAALANYRLQIRDINAQAVETNVATNASVDQAARATAQAQGATTSAAAEGGVTGNSVLALHNNLEAQDAAFQTSAFRNRTSILAQLNRNKEQAAAEAERIINENPGGNIFSTLLGVGGAGLTAAGQLQSLPRGAAAPAVTPQAPVILPTIRPRPPKLY